jgi:hypothetical protein
MTDEDGGVLGNLPRSRPGQRSEKRAGRTAAEPAPRKAAAERPAPPKQTAPPPRKSAPPPRKTAPPEPPSHAGDPVGDAIRTVTGVAATGARVAGGVAREVLRRLPRP